MSTTKKTLVRGVIWSLLDTYAIYVVKFFFALLITRILEPRDYGLVAYMSLFIGIATWLSGGGFGFALIQKKDASDIDFSTGYYYNISISIFFFLLYFVAAPLVAGFFGEPELQMIMKVTSLNLVINSLCYIHQIKLIKSLHFKPQAIMNFISAIVSGLIGLVLALLEYGYWALIFQTLIGAILRMISLWVIVKWRPMLCFNLSSFKEQFKFGSNIFLQGLLESIFREIHSLVIGKTYHTVSLGNYSRGYKFYELFIIDTGLAINKVLYPFMARRTSETDVLKKLYNQTYNYLFLIMAPITLILFLLADPIVRVLLTEKWIQSVPFMRLYFLAGFVNLLIHFNSSTLLSMNKPRLFLKLEFIQHGLMAIALFVTYNISIEFIIVGWLLAYYTYFIIFERTMTNLDFYINGKYLKMMQVLICLIPLVFFYFISNSFITNQLLLILINVVFQPLLYLLAIKVFGFEVYREFFRSITPMIPARLQILVQKIT